MASLYKTNFKIRAATSANRYIYFFKRLPLIGRLLPERVYAAGRLKTAVQVLATVLSVFGQVLTKTLYLFGMVLLMAELLVTGNMFENFSGLFPAFVHILFCLSCIVPLATDSVALKASREKYIIIRQMRADPQAFIRATLPPHYALFFLTYLPPLLLCTVFTGGSALQGLLLWLVLIAFRFVAETLQLWYFDWRGKALFRSAKPVYAVCLLGLAAAYVPPALGWPLLSAGILLSIPALVVILAVGALCVWYILLGYKNYRRAVPQNLKAEYVQPNQSAARQAAFSDVQMKEDDLNAAPGQSARLGRLHGYEFFNALFFTRHRRQLFRAVLIRLAVVGIAFAACAAALLLMRDAVAPLVLKLPTFLPIFVFVMYLASTGEKACRAMFYNCDISLLRYGFYRQPRVIVQNFNIRLRYVAGYNLMIGAAICLAALLLTAMAGGAPFTMPLAGFYASVLLLAVFFSVHHLFLYYVFQPYTTELNVKNPFYRILNMVVYLISFACLQIETADVSFALWVLGFTAVYIAAALVLVYRFSPKRFRVK